jgi:hypothetical protein
MIAILLSYFPDQANWYSDFSVNLHEGLRLNKVDVCYIRDLNKLNLLGPDDYLFVTHYKHLDELAVRQTRAKIIFHHHGSGVSPYTHWIDKKAELDHVFNVIDIHTFCMPTQDKLVCKKYDLWGETIDSISTAIGFPINFKQYEQYKGEKKKKIVVAGHIGPERQFYLATYLLKDLMPEYEVVFSIVEKPDCVTGKWSTFYDLQRFIEMGFRFVFHPDQEGYYKELRDASHVFTCSLGDTFSVSILEGYLCGCIPVVPAIFNYWPMWMDYISNGYRPFDVVDVEAYIKGKRTIEVNLDWFKPELVAKRLLGVL